PPFTIVYHKIYVYKDLKRRGKSIIAQIQYGVVYKTKSPAEKIYILNSLTYNGRGLSADWKKFVLKLDPKKLLAFFDGLYSYGYYDEEFSEFKEAIEKLKTEFEKNLKNLAKLEK
ncbi:MAG: hypothetical protein ACFFCM_22450, partial [Promethearchaeota archaeon]